MATLRRTASTDSGDALPAGHRPTMHAVTQDRYGSPDTLRLSEVDRPVPAEGELLVRVRAAAINAYDWHFMRGDPYLARVSMGLRAPKVPIRGRDFAGEVAAVGAGVTDFNVGDEVFGEANGACAEYLRVRQDMVEQKPANLSFEQAAAIPLAGNTALMGVRDLADARPGRHILINGASGGVGPFATQIAKAYGAEVTAVCSTRNADLVRSAGADHVVDYTRDDFATGEQRYDVVFDLVGNRSLRDLRRASAPGGTIVLSGGGVYEGGSLLGPLRLMVTAMITARLTGERIVQLSAVPGRANLATLRELAESGKITPIIDRTYPLGETAAAIRYLETDHARAKVVITV